MRALLIAAIVLLAAAPAQAIDIHAHRGGPVDAGVPVTPEDTLPAFLHGHELGADWIELDAKVSKDGVPVIIHDATLDRTTDCTGQVAAKTAAELAACHVDVIGVEGTIKDAPGAQVAIPTLADVLTWAKANGVRLNLEIKNIPTDPDYDATPKYAQTVLNVIDGAGFPKSHILIQSFWPANLDEAKLRGYQTLFLSLSQSNEGAIDFAAGRGYDVVSPQWPLTDPKAYVKRAHDAKLQVVPFTFNKADEIKAAQDGGVDGVITNDVIVAEQVLRGSDCPTARKREAAATKALAKARSRRSAAKRGPARDRAAAAVRSVNTTRQAAKRARIRACGPAK